MSSPPSPDAELRSVAGVDLTCQLASLQGELVAIKTETAVKMASLEGTITNLAHENALLPAPAVREPDRAQPYQ